MDFIPLSFQGAVRSFLRSFRFFPSISVLAPISSFLIRLPTSNLALSIHLSWCSQGSYWKRKSGQSVPSLDIQSLCMALRIKSRLMVFKAPHALVRAYVSIEQPPCQHTGHVYFPAHFTLCLFPYSCRFLRLEWPFPLLHQLTPTHDLKLLSGRLFWEAFPDFSALLALR